MVPTPGEILECAPEFRGSNHPEVDADATGADAGFPGPGLDDRIGPVPVGKRLHDRFGVVAGREDIHVTDRFLPAANGPREFTRRDRIEVPEEFPDPLAARDGLAEQRPLVGLPGEVDAVEDVLFGLRTEPLDILYFAGLGRCFEVVERFDAEFLVERADSFRTDPLDAREFVEFRDTARLGVLDDFRRDGVADAVDVPNRCFAVGGERENGFGMVTNVLGGPAVGSRFVLDTVRFEQVCELFQSCRNLVVVTHGWLRASSTAPAADADAGVVVSVAQCFLQKLHPALAVGGFLCLCFSFDIDGAERFEFVQRAVDADNRLCQSLAFLVGDLFVLDALFALEALATEVLLGAFDTLAFTRGNGVAATNLEDELLQIDLLALNRDFVGNRRADGGALALDSFEQLLALELLDWGAAVRAEGSVGAC